MSFVVHCLGDLTSMYLRRATFLYNYFRGGCENSDPASGYFHGQITQKITEKKLSARDKFLVWKNWPYLLKNECRKISFKH